MTPNRSGGIPGFLRTTDTSTRTMDKSTRTTDTSTRTVDTSTQTTDLRSVIRKRRVIVTVTC